MLLSLFWTIHLYACATSEEKERGLVSENVTLDKLDPYTNYLCFEIIEAEDGSTLRTNEVNVMIDCSTLSFTFFL